MAFFTRLSNGWEVAKASFKVLNMHKELIIFPVLSGISILMILASFFAVFFYQADTTGWYHYFFVFLFYLVNYFVVVFFNMALMHCARLCFEGKEVSVAKGLQFSMSRIKTIFYWALFAATVGTILKALQDNAGWLGKILISIVGFAWGIATFFVIPVLAYENVGPQESLKRSASIMKEKWGEGIGANFSISAVMFLAFLIIGVAAVAVSALVNEQVGIILFLIGALFVVLVGSTLHNIFICALYLHLDERDNRYFDQSLMDNLFVEK